MRPAPSIALVLLLAGAAATAQTGDGQAPAIARPSAAQPEEVPVRSPDAIAALKAASAAVREGFSAQIRTYADGNGILQSMFPKGEGAWTQRPIGEDGAWAVRYTGSGTVATKAEPVDFDIVWKPDRIAWLDHDAKTYYAEPPAGRKTGEAYMLASSGWTQVEDVSRGFADALEAHGLEMRDPAEVDGVRCDVVAVTAKPGADPVIWYFGRDDSLPRRSEIMLPSAELGGSIRVDFTDVKSGPDAVAGASWDIPVPNGYEEKTARSLQPRDERPNAQPAPQAGMPEWELPDSEGNLVSPSSLRGKVAVLYFWGTWSPICKKSTPEVKKLADDYAGKPVEVISLAFREGAPGDVVAAAREQGQTWRQIPQADDAVAAMSIRVAPSVIVLGPQGELLFRSGRPRGDDYEAMFRDVRTIIDRALAAAPGDDQEQEGEQGGPEARGPGQKVTPGEATPIRRIPTTRKGGG